MNDQHKVRVIQKSARQVTYGISLPKEIAERFLDITMNIRLIDNQIILTSGLNIQELKKEAKSEPIELFL